MAKIAFYEKPGCLNNGKQKSLLQAAGHEVLAYNLLTEPWTIDRLRPFFRALPVADWFNRTAVRVRSGEIVPESFDAETALAVLASDPLLIRRPLMQIGDRYFVGFDLESIEQCASLEPVDFNKTFGETDRSKIDLETCPNQD
ncbi:MAG: hypothetical protein J7641_03135 [Cyanobacteria bacterium SID2]|nr:hypothetical protein [Cyanobacteria bacterium SID2]MBP0006486.1 hypothetical protein [Cyanobacteria bacterium SBC]